MQKTRRKAVLTAAMLLLSLAVLAIPAAAEGNATITRTITPTEVFPGDDYTVTLTIEHSNDTDFVVIEEYLPEDWELIEVDSGDYGWSSSQRSFIQMDLSNKDLSGVTETITYKVTVPENTVPSTYEYVPEHCFIGTFKEKENPEDEESYLWKVNTTGDKQVDVVRNTVIELYPGENPIAAMNNAQPGDTILLNDGSYDLRNYTNTEITLYTIDDITLKSKNGPDSVTIIHNDYQNICIGSVVAGGTTTASGNIFNGITFTGNSGIYINDGPNTVITNCTFETTTYINFYKDDPVFINQCNIYGVLADNPNLVLNTTEPMSYIYKGETYTGYLGNYYDDFVGADLNDDGVVDTPYHCDTYPLAGTWDEGEIHPLLVPPIADFRVNTTYIKTSTTVQFTDLSKIPDSWSWDFDGDGVEDSTEQNPQFSYTDEGTYNVSLTVKNQNGNDTETKVDYILVRNPKTWYVDDDGGYDFTTIQDALNVALSGDEVYVYNGTYGPFYFVNQEVMVRGEDADVVTVDCNGNDRVQIGHSGCVLEGIKVVNSNYGLELSSPNCIIRNCVFDGMTDSDGIKIKGDYCLFENNIVSNSAGSYCALCIDNANCRFTNNTFINNLGAGLTLYRNAEGTIISNNNFVSNDYAGIEFFKVVGVNTIYGNNFIGNGATATTTGTSAPAVTYWNSTEPTEYFHNGVTYTGYLGNFWDIDYTGSDSDVNGIGDTSYTVPEDLGTDNAPLMTGFENYDIPPTLSLAPADASVVNGQQTQIQIVASELPEGLSGYNLTVDIADPTVAEIVDIEYPDWATVTENSSMPGASIYLKVVDLDSGVLAGAQDVVLANLTVSGNNIGSTDLVLGVERLDDDNGDHIDMVLSAGSLEVTMTPIPGETMSPQDLDGDGLYEDLTGNGDCSFADVVLFFHEMEWIEANMPVGYTDFNGNGRIDFDDVVELFDLVAPVGQ